MVNGGGLQLELGNKPKGPIDLISEKAVLIDSSCPEDFLFASDEEDEGQEVHTVTHIPHTLTHSHSHTSFTELTAGRTQ